MSANFRIIYDNAANRAALTASSAASASLGAANLLTDIKSQVLRATGTSVTITAVWPQAEIFGGVMLPYTNLGSNATVRVKAYTHADDAVPVLDTGLVLACPPAPFDQLQWGSEPLGVNAYAYGAYSCARVWFAHTTAAKLEITVSDPTNPSGYVEIGRLVCGRYWEGDKDVDYDPQLIPVDTTNNVRRDSGDLVSDLGTKHRKLVFSLSNMTTRDRRTLWNILWGNGKSVPIFCSLYPDGEDTSLEQENQIYCKLVVSPAMRTPSFLQYASTLELEES